MLIRAAIAADPRSFGKRGLALSDFVPARRGFEWKLSEDLQTFAMTFAAGFVFVSVFLA